MDRENLLPSTTVTEDSRYAWALHESDIQAQDSRISALEEQVKRISEQQQSATETHITQRLLRGDKNWIWLDNSSHIFSSRTSIPSSRIAEYLATSVWQEVSRELDAPAAQKRKAAVPLWALLQFGGAVMLFTAVGSLSFWLLGSTPMLSPFASLLTLVASPFAYLMGSAAKHE